MSASHAGTTSVVIVGASHAGLAAAIELRTAGYQGAIVLIGEEASPPYHRPHLSKESLAGEMPRPRSIRPERFYEEQAITLRLSTRVIGIDRGAKALSLSDGSTLTYGVLILATGATARRLPETIEGADKTITLRAEADWQRLATALRTGTSLAVIGGGLIGLEVAAAARNKGLSVTVVESAPRLMMRSLYPKLAVRLQDHHRTQGIDIRLGTTITAVTETGLTLTTGECIKADGVLASVGSLPCTRLAGAVGLNCSNGIDTDASGRTADPAIFALGDCAHWDHEGVAERHESVAATQFQAKAIAAAIMGKPNPGLTPLRLWSNQGALRLQMSGPVLANVHTEIDELEDGGALLRAFQSDRLIAVQAINAPRLFNAALAELSLRQRDGVQA